MKSSDRALVRRSSFGLLSALLLPGLLVVGCVSLTKPLNVQKCSSTSKCSDDPNQIFPSGDDAKKDTVDNPSPDVRFGEETPIVKPDAGPDVAPPVPDSAPDKGDSAPTNKDTAADVLNSADAGDTSPPPADVPAEKTTGAEPGPEPQGTEPGAEPSSRPEPGPEPGAEPSSRPEPGPEPGAELGREPGPEPPPDGSSGPETAPPSNCNIFYGATPSTGATGHPPATNSTAAYCVATCDDIAGWGCSNDTGRTYTVNGTSVACGVAITKKNGYYVFQVSAGTNASAVIYWWGTDATSCPAPDGGVFP
jgi:hypothetical protein